MDTSVGFLGDTLFFQWYYINYFVLLTEGQLFRGPDKAIGCENKDKKQKSKCPGKYFLDIIDRQKEPKENAGKTKVKASFWTGQEIKDIQFFVLINTKVNMVSLMTVRNPTHFLPWHSSSTHTKGDTQCILNA